MEPDYDIYPADCTPLRNRLQALDTEQASQMRGEMEALQYPKLAEMTGEQLRKVGRGLGMLERQTQDHATMEAKVAVAERLTQVGERVSEMAKVAFANYGIRAYDAADVTSGEAATMLYVLDHLPAAWFAELKDSVEMREDDKGFEQRAEEAEQDAAMEADKKATAEKVKKGGTVIEDPNQVAPSDYHHDVPSGKIDDLKAWVEEPRNDFDLSEAERVEAVALRSHQVEIAEIRRRGYKQRKSVFTAMRKYRDTTNWVPPYLRGAPATEQTPSMPGAVQLQALTEGESIHILIGHDGAVSYWVER